MGREVSAIELNEVQWWSHWGSLEWLGKNCYVLSSSKFKEPFFNRLGTLSCVLSDKDIGKGEAAFHRAKLTPYVTLLDSCGSLEKKLWNRGYEKEDEMVVQQAGKATIHLSEEVAVRTAGPDDVKDWSQTYLHSFYGDLALEREVAEIVRQVLPLDSVTLLLAELGGRVAGVTALSRTPGLLGLYCLGTLPKFRNRGVARSMLSWAQTIALSEHRTLLLQSLASEETEPFYAKFGFKRLYAKRFLRKNGVGESTVLTPFTTLIRRDPGIGPHLFESVFHGFHKVGVVRGIFGSDTDSILSELQVEVVEEAGYMHINAAKGSIIVSSPYLKSGEESFLYLDAIHELVHIRQHLEGKELWDRRYKYVDRPTELEAYRVAVEEARRIGFSDDRLVDYLKVEWVSEYDFRRFLRNLGVGSGTE